MMTNEELRADLLADPTTAEIAQENGLTVEQYIEETIAYCDNPDAGFLGGIDEPDCAHKEPEVTQEHNAYDPKQKVAGIPNHAPGEGVTSEKPAFRPRAGTFRS